MIAQGVDHGLDERGERGIDRVGPVGVTDPEQAAADLEGGGPPSRHGRVDPTERSGSRRPILDDRVDDLTKRIMKCVREDAAFVAQGFAAGVVEAGRRIVEQKAAALTNDVAGMFAAKAGEFFSNVLRTKK